MTLCSDPTMTTMQAAALMRDRAMISVAEFEAISEAVRSGSGPTRLVTQETAALLERVMLMALAPFSKAVN